MSALMLLWLVPLSGIAAVAAFFGVCWLIKLARTRRPGQHRGSVPIMNNGQPLTLRYVASDPNLVDP